MSQMLNGRYELGEIVGAGGMGAVYRATDTRLGRTVAVKALRGGALADEVARSRMRSEARLASTVHHPGVAQIYDYDDRSSTHGGMAFIVMEYIEGRSLARVLREEGRLPVEQVMSVVQQVADALAAAHAAGVVHRDLKPANIMLTATGRAVLVDFGIASSAASEPLTETGALIGTADYLSPEQAAGRPATPRSDLYSLGVVAYQCLTGTSPFRRDHHLATALAHLQDELPALDPSVPHEVRDLVRHLAEKNPVDRPADAAEVARRAGGAGAAHPVVVPATTLIVPPVRRRVRRPRVLYSGVALVVAAALLLGVDRMTSGAPDSPAPDPTPVEQVAAPTTVAVSADDLVGRTVDEAAATLQRLGLTAARNDVASSQTSGVVVGVDRTGQVPLGATVTLDVAVPLSASPDEDAPAETATPAATTAGDTQKADPRKDARGSAPSQRAKGKPDGKGHGKGKDKKR
ncbi:serine/threonine-protein kinase [Aeromicrobium endophyticum]|uniref:non-specific serine/threonine protein kinase n=1 Tax=Aeromicrobium endophyticum TaxID=2292704 RepID=A0A371P2K7_9ACTN|nr:serine/threonine-protein kinase [Aeromicrobium endophyticum]REK70187.1 serine/threonine protein kinase [Aeromicrobium endophyticum]